MQITENFEMFRINANAAEFRTNINLLPFGGDRIECGLF